MNLKAFCIFSLLVLAAPEALADKIKVGVINLKPWGSVSTTREIVGQHVDFFNELAKRTGLDFHYQILSLPRIKEYLKSGEIDMTVIFLREDMDPYVKFVGLVMPYNYYLVGKNGISFNEKQIKEIKSVGYIAGEEDVAKECFSKLYNPTAKLLPAPDYGDLLRMLNKNRFEGATIPSKGLQAYLSEIGQDEAFVNKLFILCKNEAYLQVSRKSTALNQDDIWSLRQKLISMREDGTVESIAERYDKLKK